MYSVGIQQYVCYFELSRGSSIVLNEMVSKKFSNSLLVIRNYIKYIIPATRL